MSLVLEDTDDIIHQAEREALEEWRSDKVDSFENNDGCQRSEWMECLLGSIKAFFHCCKAHRCDAPRHHRRHLYIGVSLGGGGGDPLFSPLYSLIFEQAHFRNS